MFIDRCFGARIAAAAVTLSLSFATLPAQAATRPNLAPGTIATLYAFSGTDGANPTGSLLVGFANNAPATLIGLTPAGGANGDGDLFSLGITGATFNDLLDFNGTNGAAPQGGLTSLIVPAAVGPLFGVTSSGGAYGYGAIIEALSNGAETVVYSFRGGSDGANPVGNLVYKDGYWFGVTSAGANGYGTVFRWAAHGGLKTIFRFQARNDGGTPQAGLSLRISIPLADARARAAAVRGGSIDASRVPSQFIDPALYGTTSNYGAKGAGNGTIFKITDDGQFTTLFTFTDTAAAPGSVPLAALTTDLNGNLYGTTSTGGSAGLGEVFEYSAGGTFSVVHDFGLDVNGNPATGANPASPVTLLLDGSLVGTTVSGSLLGQGVVYKITPKGAFKLEYAFGTTPTDGSGPVGPLIDGLNGKLYGTTVNGGVNGLGTVFEISQ